MARELIAISPTIIFVAHTWSLKLVSRCRLWRVWGKMLFLIGLGLGDVKDVTVKGLEAIKNAKRVYLEAYTSILTVGKDALVSPDRQRGRAQRNATATSARMGP